MDLKASSDATDTRGNDLSATCSHADVPACNGCVSVGNSIYKCSMFMLTVSKFNV